METNYTNKDLRRFVTNVLTPCIQKECKKALSQTIKQYPAEVVSVSGDGLTADVKLNTSNNNIILTSIPNKSNVVLNTGDTVNLVSTVGDFNNAYINVNKFGSLFDGNNILSNSITNNSIAINTITINKLEKNVGKELDISANEAIVLKADKIYVDGQLNATNANITDLQSNKANITDLTASNARINTLEANKANITDLTASNARINTLEANKANITDLTASNARINTLEASTANINHILAGNITAENIAAGTIAAGSSIIANGAIGSAQISDLDVSKLNAGTLDTTKITIAGANSRLTIKGNRLQVFATKADNSLYERVSLGDVNGDGSVYGFRVRGADGTTVLLDETGVKREGITDGSINNVKIAGDANISGTKLDINSVVTAINGGTTTIQSSKVLLNGQTLDVQFSNMSTTINQKANTADITNAINAMQVGGRNYALNTKNVYLNCDSPSSILFTLSDDFIKSIRNKKVTVSAIVEGTFDIGTNTNIHWGIDICVVYLDGTSTWINLTRGRGLPIRGPITKQLYSFTTQILDKEIINITNVNMFIRGTYTSFSDFSINNLKVEIGDKATDWSPAPEDTQSQIDSANNNITSIQTTVSSHTSSISALQNSITLKVDTQTFTNYQSTVNGQISSINNTLSSQSSSISVLQNQITSKVTQTDINTSINNLNIGGTNLAVGYGVYTSSAPFILSGTAKDLYYYFSSPSNRFYLKAGSYYFHVESDGTWTITHDTSGGTASSPNVVLWLAEYANSTTTTISSAIILTNGAKHTITTSGYYSFRVNCYSDGTATVTHNFWNFQIESGDKLTNWSPAPQDFQNQIDTTNSNLNTANTNITTLTTRISTAESSITQLQNSITLKVSTSDFTSYQTTVNNNFSTTNSNVTTAQNTANTAVTNASKAQTAANSAQTTANAKKRVFTSQPAPPYDVGDLWSQGTSGDMMVCKTGRASGSYTATDWAKGVKYTDDTTANAVQSNLNTTNSNLSSLTSRVSTAESKITSDAIVNTVRTSTAYISDLGQKITSAQATTIAQTASNIKIGFNGISNKVVIDTTGITINNGGFTIKNQSNATVLSEDANGNLTMAGTLKTLQDDGTDAITMSDTNIFFHDWGSGAGNNIGKIYSSHDTTSPYAAGYSIGVNRNYKFGLTYQNLETDSSGNTYTPLLVLNNGSNNGGIGRIDMWNAYLWNSTLEWRFKSTATIVANSSININHNLNKMPMITAVGTVGNIVLTFSYVDANTIRIYNYNNGGSGGNTWTGDIYFW